MMIVIRPFLLPIVAFAGIYLAVEELKRSPLHHNTIIWVLGFGFAGWAILSGYKEVKHRILLRRWLRSNDPVELREQLPGVKKAVAALPPWHRARFQAKKALIEEEAPAGTKHVRHIDDSPSRLRKQERSMADRLRNSGAFVLSVLVLGVAGALAFVQWIQIQISDFGNPTPWLIAWILIASYFGGAALLVLYDGRRRRQRRLESATQEG